MKLSAKYGLLAWGMILFLCTATYADETNDVNVTNVDIKGGLGYVFGENSSNLDIDDKGYTKCKIPFGNFTRCYLGVDSNKKIFLIRSEARFGSEEEAKTEFKYILSLLEKKYQCKFSDRPILETNNSPASKYVQIKSSEGNKFISLLCFKFTLRIIYHDNDLQAADLAQIREAERKKNNNIDAL